MNEIVKIIHNDIFTDSSVIAEGTNNQHINVKELVKDYKKEFSELGTLSVLNRESTGGRPEQYFLLNEQQATFLMTLLRNSEITVKFKLKLVKQFYAMRQILLERQSTHWQQTRLVSKTNRRVETDEIKVFVQYALEHGSKNAERYYCTLSKLANKAVGIESDSRDGATTNQLNNLILVENIINNCIQEGIGKQEYYKEIYISCKERIEQFRRIAYLQKTA